MASFTAVDIPAPAPSPASHQWYASGTTSNDVTIAAGGIVLFTYLTGTSIHNVEFTTLQPTACAANVGISTGAPTTASPSVATAAPWSGGCLFDDPGTYTFLCHVHRAMKGTVTVVGSAQPAVPSATAIPVAAPQPSPAPPAAPAPAPAVAVAATSALVASTQRGAVVRGSLAAARPDSWLYVHVVASRAGVGSRGAGNVTLGRLMRYSAAGGNLPFTVRLAPAAARALRTRGRLTVTVRVLVLPETGARLMTSSTVSLERN